MSRGYQPFGVVKVDIRSRRNMSLNKLHRLTDGVMLVRGFPGASTGRERCRLSERLSHRIPCPLKKSPLNEKMHNMDGPSLAKTSDVSVDRSVTPQRARTVDMRGNRGVSGVGASHSDSV